MDRFNFDPRRVQPSRYRFQYGLHNRAHQPRPSHPQFNPCHPVDPLPYFQSTYPQNYVSGYAHEYQSPGPLPPIPTSNTGSPSSLAVHPTTLDPQQQHDDPSSFRTQGIPTTPTQHLRQQNDYTCPKTHNGLSSTQTETHELSAKVATLEADETTEINHREPMRPVSERGNIPSLGTPTSPRKQDNDKLRQTNHTGDEQTGAKQKKQTNHFQENGGSKVMNDIDRSLSKSPKGKQISEASKTENSTTSHHNGHSLAQIATGETESTTTGSRASIATSDPRVAPNNQNGPLSPPFQRTHNTSQTHLKHNSESETIQLFHKDKQPLRRQQEQQQPLPSKTTESIQTDSKSDETILNPHRTTGFNFDMSENIDMGPTHVTHPPNQHTEAPNHQKTKTPNHQKTKTPNHQKSKTPNNQKTRTQKAKPTEPANRTHDLNIRDNETFLPYANTNYPTGSPERDASNAYFCSRKVMSNGKEQVVLITPLEDDEKLATNLDSYSHRYSHRSSTYNHTHPPSMLNSSNLSATPTPSGTHSLPRGPSSLTPAGLPPWHRNSSIGKSLRVGVAEWSQNSSMRDQDDVEYLPPFQDTPDHNPTVPCDQPLSILCPNGRVRERQPWTPRERPPPIHRFKGMPDKVQNLFLSACNGVNSEAARSNTSQHRPPSTSFVRGEQNSTFGHSRPHNSLTQNRHHIQVFQPPTQPPIQPPRQQLRQPQPLPPIQRPQQPRQPQPRQPQPRLPAHPQAARARPAGGANNNNGDDIDDGNGGGDNDDDDDDDDSDNFSPNQLQVSDEESPPPPEPQMPARPHLREEVWREFVQKLRERAILSSTGRFEQNATLSDDELDSQNHPQGASGSNPGVERRLRRLERRRPRCVYHLPDTDKSNEQDSQGATCSALNKAQQVPSAAHSAHYLDHDVIRNVPNGVLNIARHAHCTQVADRNGANSAHCSTNNLQNVSSDAQNTLDDTERILNSEQSSEHKFQNVSNGVLNGPREVQNTPNGAQNERGFQPDPHVVTNGVLDTTRDPRNTENGVRNLPNNELRSQPDNQDVPNGAHTTENDAQSDPTAEENTYVVNYVSEILYDLDDEQRVPTFIKDLQNKSSQEQNHKINTKSPPRSRIVATLNNCANSAQKPQSATKLKSLSYSHRSLTDLFPPIDDDPKNARLYYRIDFNSSFDKDNEDNLVETFDPQYRRIKEAVKLAFDDNDFKWNSIKRKSFSDNWDIWMPQSATWDDNLVCPLANYKPATRQDGGKYFRGDGKEWSKCDIGQSGREAPTPLRGNTPAASSPMTPNPPRTCEQDAGYKHAVMELNPRQNQPKSENDDDGNGGEDKKAPNER